MTDFATAVLAWAAEHGRHDLPWQNPRTPYRVWVSEIMLQQTQVERVKYFFERFMQRFPDIASLAAATEAEVMPYWAGLGYYARARNLHKAAGIVSTTTSRALPESLEALTELPGIGRSTAGAIRSLGQGAYGVILDGNVKRVLCRYAGIRDWPGQGSVQKSLWSLAASLTPTASTAAYNQAMMDIGATLCTRRRPACERCPVAEHCVARAKALTAVIPAPKPKQVRPIRHRFVLVAHDRRRVLLEKRPSSGLWGGLWSLPETDKDAPLPEAGEVFSRLLGLPLHPGLDSYTGSTIQHDFTHYRLMMTPVYLAVDDASAGTVHPERLADGTYQWHELKGLDSIALPAPIMSLLKTFARTGVGQLSLDFSSGEQQVLFLENVQ
ncbi:A/G-specific adenine glycosylase [Allohahella marinimesophila]|uniref:Adenine DNA glycosylase n=1 Tax=Allohahella marinimesophila TaxID=1054972 RepID=A0ABP7Q0X7_9GAMM